MAVLDKILLSANNVKGDFLNVGFGTGSNCKEIYNLMLDNSIVKRNFLIIDKANPEKASQNNAVDLVNEVRNRLKKNSSYIKEDFTSYKTLNFPTYAIMNFDLEDDAYNGIKVFFPSLKRDGIVIVRHYKKESVKGAVDKYLKDINSLSKVESEENISYIIVKDNFNLINKPKIGRTKSELT